MARKPKQVDTPIEFIAMRRITINATGQTFDKYSPFPSGLEGVDYTNLLASKFIKTLADFQQIDTGRCLSCGE